MEENFKPTSEVLEIFKTIEHIFMQDMKEVISEFAEEILIKADNRYDLHNDDKDGRYIIIENNISLCRSNKTLLFRLFQTKDMNGKDSNVSYYIYIYIRNSIEKNDYFKDLSPLYYLETIGKEYLVKLFPEQYIAKKNDVNKKQIYEYVHKYLEAVKILLKEPEIKRLLYDPTYWVYVDPYAFF